MGKLVRLEFLPLPKILVVGKELRMNMEEHMKGPNQIPGFWETCMSDGTFTVLEQNRDLLYDSAYVGFMTDWDRGDGCFSYICGMLYKEGSPVPGGYISRETEPTDAAISWIRGRDVDDVCQNAHTLTEQAVKDAGYSLDALKWTMELYHCPRFTTPDAYGEIILDYYIPCTRIKP